MNKLLQNINIFKAGLRSAGKTYLRNMEKVGQKDLSEQKYALNYK